jgi:hypothetical protein
MKTRKVLVRKALTGNRMSGRFIAKTIFKVVAALSVAGMTWNYYSVVTRRAAAVGELAEIAKIMPHSPQSDLELLVARYLIDRL